MVPSHLQFSVKQRLFLQPLCYHFIHLQSLQSLEGLFPQNESYLIKINILVVELKETQHKNLIFYERQKCPEVLASVVPQCPVGMWLCPTERQQTGQC